MQKHEHIEHIDLSQEHHKSSAHAHIDKPNYSREYFKFAGVLALVFFGAVVHFTIFDMNGDGFLDSFMGVFFLTFAAFKLIGLQDFVIGFADYDIIAKKFPAYSYFYPFLQLFFAVMYLLIGATLWLDVLVLVVSMVGVLGIWRTLRQRGDFHCVCLGNVIQLPLSRISLVEDLGMAVMAGIMLLSR